jgi:hypothetical protein
MRYLNLAKAALLSTGFVLASPAHAVLEDVISETFKSGATFTGILKFDAATLAPISVDGVLTGYQANSYGYSGGTVEDHIQYVFDNTQNYAAAPFASNWLLDVPANSFDASLNNILVFTINFTNPNHPVFDTSDGSNGINMLSPTYNDPLKSGSITAVPEPAALSIFALGAAVLRLRLRTNFSIKPLVNS